MFDESERSPTKPITEVHPLPGLTPLRNLGKVLEISLAHFNVVRHESHGCYLTILSLLFYLRLLCCHSDYRGEIVQ